MAELTDPTPANTSPSSCCAPAAQQTCCEPSEKTACCDTAAAGGACGCAAGHTVDAGTLRETVRERYAAAATQVASGEQPSDRCGPDLPVITDEQVEQLGAALYAADERGELPDTALLASLGCGNPFAVAELQAGETVLDLGSGGGIDVLLSARRVGPTGMAYGLDMTDEMLDLARANQAKAGLTNVHWLKGHIEGIPLAAGTVDVVLSNCVINLSTDKPQALREAARVLKPGGRFAVSDIVADADMDDATRADLGHYVGCIAGALTRHEYAQQLSDAGLIDVEVVETHRVHEHAGSAIVRARKPVDDPHGTASSDRLTATDRPKSVPPERRRIYNPVQDDAVTFLETSAESGGERSLAELDVAPGGKVTPHYHLSYTERFAVTEGRLDARVGDVHQVLGPGEELTVPIGTVHAWSNASAERTVAHLELRPGQPGFETSLRVVYGLASDGKVLKNGVPRNPLHAGLLLEWAETRLPGAFAVLEPGLRLLARVARLAQVDRKLEARYP